MALDVEKLYKRYGPMVLRRCRSMLKDEERARDAMQEVFIRILKNHETLEEQYPSSLLYTTATHVCLNILRTIRRHPEDSDPDLLQTIADGSDTERQIGARRILEKIFQPHEQSTRVMATLHYVDGLTLQETAREMQLSVSGVRKRLRTFKESLPVHFFENYGKNYEKGGDYA